MVCNQNANAARLQMTDDGLNVRHRNRVNAGKWFVQEDKTRCQGDAGV